jgi:putative membrane protein
VANGNSGSKVNAKMILVGLLVVLIAALAVANRQNVTVHLLVHTFRMPLFLVIVGSALAGWVVGWFMGRSRN